MQRALAAVLVLVFSFPLIAPAFASQVEEANLPACCRRDGKHHCAMSMTLGSVPSRYAVVGEKCPFPLLARPALMLPHAFAAPGPGAMAALAKGPSLMVRQAEAGYRVSLERARHKRGPPSFRLL